MVVKSPTRDKILCYLIIVCFIRGRFIPSHGEVLCFCIAWVEWDEESTQGEEEYRRRVHCLQLLCFFALLAEDGRRKRKGSCVESEQRLDKIVSMSLYRAW
jgi:hypothetical protein